MRHSNANRIPCCSTASLGRLDGRDALFEDALICEPERSLLKDLRTAVTGVAVPLDHAIRTRTAVDRRRKVVRGQHLFSTETVPIGLRFEAQIRGIKHEQQHDLLHTCIQVLTTFGGDSTRGLGFCKYALAKVHEPAAP
jgi:CRISPR/Cas system CSM-associated protein Csm3 (group 7 of RAMP superfamily)